MRSSPAADVPAKAPVTQLAACAVSDMAAACLCIMALILLTGGHVREAVGCLVIGLLAKIILKD